VELRVADVCTDVDDAVLLAALARALVTTAAAGGEGAGHWRADLLRAAQWRAARDGLTGRLVDPRTCCLNGARDVVDSLIDHVGAALEETGDLEVVRDLARQVVGRGGGAEVQRAFVRSGGSLPELVGDLARRTGGAER
jgi:carboxylate-amine ligase